MVTVAQGSAISYGHSSSQDGERACWASRAWPEVVQTSTWSIGPSHSGQGRTARHRGAGSGYTSSLEGRTHPTGKRGIHWSALETVYDKQFLRVLTPFLLCMDLRGLSPTSHPAVLSPTGKVRRNAILISSFLYLFKSG